MTANPKFEIVPEYVKQLGPSLQDKGVRDKLTGIAFELLEPPPGSVILVSADRAVFKSQDLLGLAESMGLSFKRQGRNIMVITCHEALEIITLDRAAMLKSGWMHVDDLEEILKEVHESHKDDVFPGATPMTCPHVCKQMRKKLLEARGITERDHAAGAE